MCWVINPIIKLHVLPIRTNGIGIAMLKDPRRDNFCLIINILSQLSYRKHVIQCNICNIKNHPPSTICLDFWRNLVWEPQILNFPTDSKLPCATPALISRSRFVDRNFCSATGDRMVRSEMENRRKRFCVVLQCVLERDGGNRFHPLRML